VAAARVAGPAMLIHGFLSASYVMVGRLAREAGGALKGKRDVSGAWQGAIFRDYEAEPAALTGVSPDANYPDMSLSLLIAHPKTFLKANAVWVHGQLNFMTLGRPDTIGTTGMSKCFPVQLQRSQMKHCTDKSGGNMPCWEIVPATSLGEFTLAYYLPYRQNAVTSMLIGNKANLFLTDTIDGCTFAAGPGAAPLVSHLNYTVGRQEGALIDQGQIDEDLDELYPAGGIQALKKAQYKTDDQIANVTVVGVRQSGAWKFVYQRRDNLGGGNFRLRSVHSVKSLP
jgi:hypothetical protein